MSNHDAKALQESIEHWRRLYEAVKSGVREVALREGWTGGSCPLCREYATDENCFGCPVSNRTGLGGCAGTPWRRASSALADWAAGGMFPKCFTPSVLLQTALIAVKEELDFLTSLAPKTTNIDLKAEILALIEERGGRWALTRHSDEDWVYVELDGEYWMFTEPERDDDSIIARELFNDPS